MQRPSNPSISTLFLCTSASLLLGGCATNLAPVRSFAEQTQKMSLHFEPMLAGGVHSCMDKAMRKRLILAERFDAQASEQAARADCAAIAQASMSIAGLNDVLLRYAHTLAALADDKLPVYKEEFAGLGDSLGGLAQPGAGAPLLDADKLSRVVKLSEHLSRLATQRLQKSALRELLDEQEAVNIVSDALKEYAQRSYRAGLQDELRDLAQLRGAVDNAAPREPLAANYIRTHLHLEGRQLQDREKIVAAYVAAVDALQASVAALRANLDQPQAPELARQLALFSQHVETLQKQAVFYGPARW
ncbi:hypothetical protein [Janthinobacterium sp. GW458P]|uniref:hypothetical protein n=1 Tax=Janthinobacterium sp. GW458P TaxID=1981504 RepID=UPI000A3244B2|nr:hypothetical protein [Janthinobacterium sp. GW458P]MBE3025852.1 hypothetical protein [Janthinobacterium sp. GW458P]PHV14674.1 hypothetical protein CSQ90_22295 [Janthinobacterium sp. BJB303]